MRAPLPTIRTFIVERRALWLATALLGGGLAVLFLLTESRAVSTLVAVLAGGGGTWGLLWAADRGLDRLGRRGERLRPLLYIAPALSLVGLYLVYPALHTVVISLQERGGGLGLESYFELLSKTDNAVAVRNSLLWAVVAPAVIVALGLSFAVIMDRVSTRFERVAKSLVFLPMAISFVGASAIWTFVYSFRPEGFGRQIGLLNAFVVSLGGEPRQWLALEPWNNVFLMAILIWIEVGFATVILSAAVKTVPDELADAARVEGAGEWQVFKWVTVPSIRTTIVVVWTTALIYTWNTFDIVFVMTGGLYDTTVLAERMVTEFFTFGNQGVGAALAVAMLVVVVPVMVRNIRSFRAQEELR